MTTSFRRKFVAQWSGSVAAVAALLCFAIVFAEDSPKTGSATETRFPPLQVPAGFKATLFACDPLIEYPSVISAGPRPGAVFVAIDYMTGLGTEIVRRSEVRLVEDTNNDGYADKASVYAGGFNSIMGLAWHDETLFVMHAPFLTALRDTTGMGVANERRDIVTGLGLRPEDNPVRLHCANGVTAGHDGWLYLALGDHGCDVQRAEGDRLVLEGGGVLRCRPDGRDLHIFSMGLRNIYDVALDAELNVLLRDNENDGGDYKIRVCHSFFGADHGYPYLYLEDPAEPLKPLADLGLRSSAGGVCYLERQFPPELRGTLFYCEWGKSLVHYPLRSSGSSFASPQEIEFAVGGPGDPYGFKPTDVVVQRDGSIMVSDYADGQRPKRGRGRIYHIKYVGDAKPVESAQTDPIKMLDSESYYERCDAQRAIERDGAEGSERVTAALAQKHLGARARLHAIWILANLRGAEAVESLFKIAAEDPEPVVRAQAVRAIADLTDPVLVQHRLDAGPGNDAIAERLAVIGINADPRVALEVVVAFSRLRWPGSVSWLKQHLRQPDAALTHAAMQAMRESGNWKDVLHLLDAPSTDPLRSIPLRAASRQYNEQLVDGLIQRAATETDVARVQEYANCLARVHKKPGPWVYWDYRPKPRPTNPLAWQKTDAVAESLNQLLTRDDFSVRMAALMAMQREKVPARLETLGSWLQRETNPQHLAAILQDLRTRPVADVHRYLLPVIKQPLNTSTIRLDALAMYSQGIDSRTASELLVLTEELEDGVVLAEALRMVSKYPQLQSTPILVRKLGSTVPEVRAAAIQSLGDLKVAEARGKLPQLLSDENPLVRRAAADAAGSLDATEAAESLLKLAQDGDVLVRAASLKSLRLLKEQRALPLAIAALENRETDRPALELLNEFGGPQHASAVVRVAKNHPSMEILTAAVQTLQKWGTSASASARQLQEIERAVADIQGSSGNLMLWRVSGLQALPADLGNLSKERVDWRIVMSGEKDGRVRIDGEGTAKDLWYIAWTDLHIEEPSEVEIHATTGENYALWLNGKSIHERKQPPAVRTEPDRIATTFVKGLNQLVMVMPANSPQSNRDFQIRFRRRSSVAEREQFASAALSRAGNSDRGRTIFMNAEKSLCIKCHRMNDTGERIGPELTGLGARFSKTYIVESILEPSRNIAPSFGTSVLEMKDGRILSGIRNAESDQRVTIVDNQGQKHELAKADIETQSTSPTSTMPDGLEKRLTQQEFVDLVTFLSSGESR